MELTNDLVLEYGGKVCRFKKGELIFLEGMTPVYFHQILEGSVRMFTTNSEGKSYAQGQFESGQCFGEPPLLLKKPYPASAQACCNSKILRISREKFLRLLNDYPQISIDFLYLLSERVYQKSQFMQIWGGNNPEEKILTFLKIWKNECNAQSDVAVPFTRQQIAERTGLRVETVIRTLKRMCEEGKVRIVERKLYY